MTRLLLLSFFFLPFYLLAADPPANDNLADAVEVSNTFIGTDVGGDSGQLATLETDEVSCDETVSWWYTLTPEYTGEYRLIADGLRDGAVDSTNDVTLGVYTGGNHPLTEVACFDNDNGEAGGEQEQIILTGGVTYYIRVGVQPVEGLVEIGTSIFRLPVTWLGTEDSDWYNPNNWESGELPTAGDEVIIVSMENGPIISSGTVEILSLSVIFSEFTLEAGANLHLSGGSGGLSVTSGTKASINGTVIIEDQVNTGLQVISGELSVGASGMITVHEANFGQTGTLVLEGSLVINDPPLFGVLTTSNSVTTIAEGASLLITNPELHGCSVNGTFQIDGEVTISSSEDDGLFVGNPTDFSIGETGQLNISNSAGDGIYFALEKTLNNAGLRAISNSGGQAINGGIFNNAAGATLRVADTVSADITFEPTAD